MFVTRGKSDNDRKPTLPVRVKTMFVTRGNSDFTSGVHYKSQCAALSEFLISPLSSPSCLHQWGQRLSPSGMLAIGIERYVRTV